MDDMVRTNALRQSTDMPTVKDMLSADFQGISSFDYRIIYPVDMHSKDGGDKNLILSICRMIDTKITCLEMLILPIETGITVRSRQTYKHFIAS